MSFNLYDLSDRELLFRLDDIKDDKSLATSQEVADALGLKGVAARQVAIRLSWLKRFGAVNWRETLRVSEETGRKYKIKAWYLTPAGERMIFGHLDTKQKRNLEKIEDDSLIDVIQLLSGRYKGVNKMGRTLLNRQWRSGTGVGRRR